MLDNKIASENKISVFGDFKIDTHFEELALMFFPVTRSAMIQTRLLEFAKVQAKTILDILNMAKEIKEKHNIKFETPPAKFALPLLEKMSLETDEHEMQKEWAKLLIAAGNDYKPIQLQYIQILSQIGTYEAILLKEIYEFQKINYQIETETSYKREINTFNENQIRTEIAKNLRIDVIECTGWKGDEWEKTPYETEIKGLEDFYDEPKFDYLYKIYSDIIPNISYSEWDIFDKKLLNSLQLLQNLGLIQYEFIYKNDLPTYIKEKKDQLRMFLTNFGYLLLETLEEPQ